MQNFKKKVFTSLLGIIGGTSSYALQCNVDDIVKKDWQADITFECDVDVDLMANPVTFKLSNGATSSGAWGLADAKSEGSGSTVKVSFTEWSGSPYILKANTPATFTYSHNTKNYKIESFKVGDSKSSNSNFTASVKLKSFASPSVPEAPVTYHVLNSVGKEIAKGDVSFSNDITIDLPLTAEKKETFTIEFDKLYEYTWVYTADPIAFEVAPNQQESVNVVIQGESYPVVKFDAEVTGFEDIVQSGNEPKPTNVKFIHSGDRDEVILPVTHSGAYKIELPKNTGTWTVEVQESPKYGSTLNTSTIDTDTAIAQNLTIAFEAQQINTSSLLGDLLTQVALQNGYSDAKSYYQDLFAFHLSEDAQKNPVSYADFKVAKTANANATEYFSYHNMIEAYQRLASNPSSSDFMSTFLANSNEYDNIREIAAFFANVGQETNGGTVFTDGTFTKAKEKPAAGLMYAMSAVSEGQCYHDAQTGSQNSGCNYDHAGAQVDIPGIPGVQYYGRGPKQLSYPENYYNYGKYAFDEDGNYLDSNDEVAIFANPDLVITDPVRGWETAFAFMIKADTSNQFFKKPSMMQAMHEHSLKEVIGNETKHGPAGFGHAINVINGGIECKSNEVVYQQLNRINNYLELLIRFGVPIEKVDVEMNDGSYYDPSTLTIQAMKKRVYPDSWAKTSWGSYIIHTQPLPVDLYNYNTKKEQDAQHIVKIVLHYSDETELSSEVLSCGIGFQPYGL